MYCKCTYGHIDNCPNLVALPADKQTLVDEKNMQPLMQNYDLQSHTTSIVCVNFIHKWRDLQFEVDFQLQFLKNFSLQFYLHS